MKNSAAIDRSYMKKLTILSKKHGDMVLETAKTRLITSMLDKPEIEAGTKEELNIRRCMKTIKTKTGLSKKFTRLRSNKEAQHNCIRVRHTRARLPKEANEAIPMPTDQETGH